MERCKVISHRGANRRAPQNTMPAFIKSDKIGVDGFETDVHVTSDGVPVICHNYSIDSTSNGKGFISKLSLDELKSHEFGSYFNTVYSDVTLPTLEEFLDFCSKSKITIMNIELKKPFHTGTEVVRKTIEAVKEHGIFDKLLISSFDPELLLEAKRIDPGCQTGYLYSPITNAGRKVLLHPAEFALEIGADALHPHYCYVSKKYVESVHNAGVKINAWTVNKPEVAVKLIKEKVDGLITDRPEMAKALIHKYGE